jgi:hypothetical protein
MRQNSTENDIQIDALQIQAIEHLIAGKTISATATALDIHRSTLHTWHKEPGFMAALNRSRADILNSIHSRMLSLAATAVDTISGLMSDPAGDPKIRLAAATRILQGLSELPKIGSGDPESIRQDQVYLRLLSGLPT